MSIRAPDSTVDVNLTCSRKYLLVRYKNSLKVKKQQQYFVIIYNNNGKKEKGLKA